MAVEAGWPGLLIDEERGGAGLEAFDALLVAAPVMWIALVLLGIA